MFKPVFHFSTAAAAGDRRDGGGEGGGESPLVVHK